MSGSSVGLPSTLGGMIVLVTLVDWVEHPLLVAMIVGATCIKLVAFRTRYRHLGHWSAALPGGVASYTLIEPQACHQTAGTSLDRRCVVNEVRGEGTF